jgi:hypothetical protein
VLAWWPSFHTFRPRTKGRAADFTTNAVALMTPH